MLKKQILWLHKWLGLLCGIIVFIVSLTGCIYVFYDDLKLVVYPEKYFTDTGAYENHEPMTISHLAEIAQQALPADEKLSRIDLYPAKDRTWIFRALKRDNEAFGYWNYYTYYKCVFVNPYTGKVQQVENTKYNFFQVVLQLHMNLLLGKKTGGTIVGSATIVFIIILLSGLVLWWPKKWKRKTLKRSLWFDFKVNRKRLNYDLHNILGIYSICFALLFSVTGLVFAFPAFKNTYIKLFNSLSSDRTTLHRLKDYHLPDVSENTTDNGLYFILQQHPNADMVSIRLKEDTTQDMQVRLKKNRSGHFLWYYFDKETNSIKDVETSDQQRAGNRLASMNYDLHVGSYGGFGTKILTFFMALICASLPVTGVIIWLNKEKKKKKKRV